MSTSKGPYDDDADDGFVVVDEADDPEVPLEELFPGARVVRGVGADAWEEETEPEAHHSSRARASPRLGCLSKRAETSSSRSIADDITAASTPHAAAIPAHADSCDERDDTVSRLRDSSESTHTVLSEMSTVFNTVPTAAPSQTTPASPIDDTSAETWCTDSSEAIVASDARDGKTYISSGTMPCGVTGELRVPQGVSVRIAPTSAESGSDGLNIEVELSLDHEHCGRTMPCIARGLPSSGRVARGCVVLILGPTASGKTSLVRQVTERARSEGLVVVTSEDYVSWDPARAVVSQFGSAVS